MTAQEIIYAGAGNPIVRSPTGEPLSESALGDCAHCGGEARFRVVDCLSSNFVVCKQLRLGAKGFCRACAFCLRDLRLRCAPWVATTSEVRFCVDRWGILDFLLAPPAPPFVAGVPWFGISKGGMGNIQYCRVWHPERETQELSPEKVDESGAVLRAPQVMPKLQSKHTAMGSQVVVDTWRARCSRSGHLATPLLAVAVPAVVRVGSSGQGLGMIDGDVFITPHAVCQYQARARAGWLMSFEGARQHLVEQMAKARAIKPTGRGAVLFRGPKPERLRLIVGPGESNCPALVTVLTKSDRD